MLKFCKILVGRVWVLFTIALSVLFSCKSKEFSAGKNLFIKPAYPSLTDQKRSLRDKKIVKPIRLLDSSRIINDLKFLSSDECEGRSPGTNGHRKAVERILARMREIGLDSFGTSLLQRFNTAQKIHGTKEGKNVIGYLRGTKSQDKYIVISAHYDHLGIINGEIFHGASDNASGTACMLAIAEYYKKHPLAYSLIFVAFDREEIGLEGSKYFIDNSSISLEKIKFNLNIDLIARNDSNEIFICGVKQNPALRYLVDSTQKKVNVKLLMGHDTEDWGKGQNWVYLSDHAPFYVKGIPFLYIGVEDHVDYHKPTDTWEKFDLGSYIENCNLILQMIQEIKL